MLPVESPPQEDDELDLRAYISVLRRHWKVVVDAIGTVERGRNVYDVFVVVDPGATAVVRYAVHGQVPAGRRYRLDVHRQPTVAADRVHISVNGRTVYDDTQAEDLRIDTRL